MTVTHEWPTLVETRGRWCRECGEHKASEDGLGTLCPSCREQPLGRT